jgi:putative transcriptional regulator
MKQIKATIDSPYRYDLTGLKNVFLAGIAVYGCAKCRTEVPIIRRAGELHRVIARLLLNKPALLTGDEIRFLRKNAGISAKDFAAQLQTSAEHLSRVENGHYPSLGPTADKFARLLIMAASDKQDIRALLLRAKALLIAKRRKRRPIRLKLEGHRWKEAA